eukprot:12896399-Prorocentrum_lima.AAC.1
MKEEEAGSPPKRGRGAETQMEEEDDEAPAWAGKLIAQIQGLQASWEQRLLVTEMKATELHQRLHKVETEEIPALGSKIDKETDKLWKEV